MFNQQKTGFGASAFGTGNTSGGLFGNKTNTTGGGLFGNSSFGATSTSGGFGFGNTSSGNIFGTPASKATGGGLFATPTQNTFGASTQSSFGTSGFSQNRSGGLFAGSTPASTSSSFGGGGVFGTSGGFGQAQQQNGTGAVKFVPTTGSDTAMKNGIQSSISTKHQCITAMKEYEGKSFEELRTDDYLAGRKGPGTGTTSFGGATSSAGTGFSFGQKSTAATGGLFGSSTAKPAFGQATGGGLFGNTNTSSSGGGLFGSSKPFGAATTSSGGGFSFGASSSTGGSIFGNTANKPAGGMFGNTATPTTGGLFGNTGSSGFGGSNTFGGGGGSNLFGNKPTAGFGASTQGNTGFGTSGGLFGSSTSKPTTGLFGSSGFGQQSGGSLFGKTGFGSTNTTNATGSLFGNTLTASTTQNKSLFSGFGQNTGSTLGNTGFNFNAGGNTLGGNFGAGGAGFSGSLFGQSSGAGAGNTGTLPLSAGSNKQTVEMLQTLLAAPFGDSPLFKNSLADPEKRQEVLKPTNPIAQKAALQSPLYRVSPGLKSKIKPKARSSQSAGCPGKPHQLFAGLEPEEEADVSNRSFVGRSSVKKLTIKVTPNTGSYRATPPESTSDLAGEGGRRGSDVLKSSESAGLRRSSNTLEGVESGNIEPNSVPSGIPSAIPSSIPSSILGTDIDAETSKQRLNDSTDHLPSRSSVFETFTKSAEAIPEKNTASRSQLSSPAYSANQFNDTYSDLQVRVSKTAPQANETTTLSSAHIFDRSEEASRVSSFADSPHSTPSFVSPKNTLQLLEGELEKNGLDESEQEEKEPEQPHPAGIKLRRPGYYTIPAVYQLANMVDENGRCKITDFTVGRQGYGSVFFEGEVDITGMNLDAIVHIRRKEVTIYPDDDDKPPLGQGLNRPAEITLDCVWPIDKATREPVSDPDRLVRMRWESKLELTTSKMGARFVDYRPDTGSWVFQVSHFSKYGLPESEDEAENEVEQPLDTRGKSKKDLISTKKTTLWSTRVNKDLSSESVKPNVGLGGVPEDVVAAPRAGVIHEEGEMDGDVAGDNYSAPTEKQHVSLYETIGLKSHKLQSMKASFFADDEEDQDGVLDSSLPPAMTQTFLKSTKSMSTPDTQLTTVSQAHKSMSLSSLSPSLKKKTPSKSKRLKKLPSAEFTPVQVPSFLRQTKQPTEGSPALPLQLPPAGLEPVKTAAPTHRRMKMPTKQPPRRKPALQLNTLRTDSASLPCDAAQFLGRSFRVGWGPGWTLVHSGKNITSTIAMKDSSDECTNQFIFAANQANLSRSPQDFTVHVEKIKSAPHLPEPPEHPGEDDDVISDLYFLAAALRHSDVVRSSEDMQFERSDLFSQTTSNTTVSSQNLMVSNETALPFFQPSKDKDILDDYANIAKEAWTSVDSSHPDSGYTHLCHLVFGLCRSLWGSVDGDIEESSYARQMLRKKMLFTWLVDSVEADKVVGQRPDYDGSDPLDEIYYHVTEGRLDKAMECALGTGNTGLACLLSISCSTISSPVAIAKQLIEWLEVEADQHISDVVLRIYALLAAKPVWLSSKGAINTCAGLDWKRSLLLHLTFLSKPVSPIADPLQQYRAAWKGNSEFGVYSAAPIPPYIERSRTVINDSSREDCPVRDICYHLVQLYCKRSHGFEATLCPSSSVPHPTDYRVAWHTWRALHAAGYRRNLKRTSTNKLHVSYAAQLEAHGLWHQAVFVLMHITENREREVAVKKLLSRHVHSEYANQALERFVVEELGVPGSWLHECRALHAKSLGDKESLARHLLASGHWKSGHGVFMKDVAADALIHERYRYIYDLLSMILDYDGMSAIPGWDGAGKVYLDYLNLTRSIQKLEGDDVSLPDIEAALEELRPQVTSLCQRVAQLKCCSAKDNLARAEMAKQVLNLYNVMHALLKQQDMPSPFEKSRLRHPVSESASTSVVAPQATRLHLPEDYAMEDLSKIVHNHFIELYSMRNAND